MTDNSLEKLLPLRLRPIPTAKVWGGSRLSGRYGKPMPAAPDPESADGVIRLGETLELVSCGGVSNVIVGGRYGGRTLSEYLCAEGLGDGTLPVTVKYIDAGEALSVQVHPKKTELWYIVEADSDAGIIYGFEGSFLSDGGFDREGFVRAARDGSIGRLLHRIPVRAGEFYMIPSGLVHALGGGILAAEFQQSDSVTLRAWDFGRDRPVQTEEAADAVSRLGIYKLGDGIAEPGLAECEYFSVKRYFSDGDLSVKAEDGMLFLTCVRGSGSICGDKLCRGDSFLLPAGGTAYIAGNDLTLLTMSRWEMP